MPCRRRDIGMAARLCVDACAAGACCDGNRPSHTVGTRRAWRHDVPRGPEVCWTSGRPACPAHTYRDPPLPARCLLGSPGPGLFYCPVLLPILLPGWQEWLKSELGYSQTWKSAPQSSCLGKMLQHCSVPQKTLHCPRSWSGLPRLGPYLPSCPHHCPQSP